MTSGLLHVDCKPAFSLYKTLRPCIRTANQDQALKMQGVVCSTCEGRHAWRSPTAPLAARLVLTQALASEPLPSSSFLS